MKKFFSRVSSTLFLSISILILSISLFPLKSNSQVFAEDITSYATIDSCYGFLKNVCFNSKEYVLKDLVKSYIFTNKLADFGSYNINNPILKTSVGSTCINSVTDKKGLYAYLYLNDDYFDCIVYADVQKIYAPTSMIAFFGPWYTITGDTYNIYWSQENVESIVFRDCFDTSNVTDMCTLFHDLPKLTKLDLSMFDTSNLQTTTNIGGTIAMFAGCSSLRELDISSFTLNQLDTRSCLGMLGINQEYLTSIFGSDTSEAIYSQTTLDEKISAFAQVLKSAGFLSNTGECKLIATSLFNTNIAKIIAPTASLDSSLKIGLSGDTEYVNSTTSEKTWFLQGGSNVVLTQVKDVSSTGLTLSATSIYCSAIAVALIVSMIIIYAKKRKKIR